jgi:hypothetical protein
MSKTIILVLVAAVILAAGFAGGYLVANKTADSAQTITNTVGGRSAQGGPGGAFAQLTDEERQQLQNMTDAERQQFFKDKGIDMPQGFDRSGVPSGAPAGTSGMMRVRGSGGIEGTIVSSGDGKITVKLADGGSMTAYVDDKTLLAAVSGATAKLTPGASVYMIVEPEATGVTAAKAIIVK